MVEVNKTHRDRRERFDKDKSFLNFITQKDKSKFNFIVLDIEAVHKKVNKLIKKNIKAAHL